MANNININKLNVEQLMKLGADNTFVMPEYQRLYSWEADKHVEKFFDDLWEFTGDCIDNKDTSGTYFLGCIVTNENEGRLEIVDGQQRMITLSLFLRAAYHYLENAEHKTDGFEALMSDIRPLICKKVNRAYNFQEPLITSEVVGSEENEVFLQILRSGIANPKAKDNYSKCYCKLQRMIADKASNNDMYVFFDTILSKVVVSHIHATAQDDALTIFNTLNDRGLVLDDADVFKAKIYKSLPVDERKDFIKKWQDLSSAADKVEETMQSLFYYFMFYIRALNKDAESTMPKLRSYFLDKKKYPKYDNLDRLLEPQTLVDVENILELWINIKALRKDSQYKRAWSENVEIRRSLDILTQYPNEFWKYPVVTFYLVHKENSDFEELFGAFLHKLIALIVPRYLEDPSVNGIKGDIVKLDVAITETPQPLFSYHCPDIEDFREKIVKPNRNMVRMLLTILAYSTPKQETPLKPKWEIEHIFPVRWKGGYDKPLNCTDEEIDEAIEHLGNKLPLEKAPNIKASNDFFANKREAYKTSGIAIVRDFLEYPIMEWGVKNIKARDAIVSDAIIKKINEIK